MTTGAATDHPAWRKIIPALAARYMVIAPDLRGCGDTDRPDVAFDRRMAAEDIHQLVQHLGVGAVNLVGHDVGTMASYAYAATYRSEIRRLALMESALPSFGLEELYDPDSYPRMYHLGLSDEAHKLPSGRGAFRAAATARRDYNLISTRTWRLADVASEARNPLLPSSNIHYIQRL